MSHEQNIDDILKLLKESVTQSSDETPSTDENKKKTNAVSENSLKKQLKNQYASQAIETEAEQVSSDSYALDQDFLKEMGVKEEKKTSTRVSASPKSKKVKTAVATKEAIEQERPVVAQSEPSTHEVTKTETVFESIESVEENDRMDIAPWEIAEEKIELQTDSKNCEKTIADTAVMEVSEDEEEREVVDSEELEWIPKPTEESVQETKAEQLEGTLEHIDPLPLAKQISNTIPQNDEDEIEYQEFPEIQAVSMTEWMRDYESDEEQEAVSVTEDTVVELIPEDLFTEGTIKEDAAKELNDSVFDLMIRLGCEDELDELTSEEISEEFLEDFDDLSSQDKDEFQSEEQIDDIRERYRRQSVLGMLRLLLAGALTILLFFYDTLPLFGADFGGLTNYRDYPGAYLLIGTQILLLCAICQWKALIDGIKRLFTLRANLFSMVSLLLIATIGYDIVMVVAVTTSLPIVFHFLCALALFCAQISDFSLLRREIKIFSVYSSISYKYTLKADIGKHSMAQKMYNGGLDSQRKVFFPAYVEFPRGLFRSIRENGKENRIYGVLIFPVLFLSLIAAVLGILLEESIEIACVSAMTVLLVALPLGTMLSEIVPLCASATSLKKRGIALTGKETIEKYAQGDVVIFRDLHLFRKCNAKDTGMVFYEQAQATRILGCLQLLYTHLGGPMASVFENVPESYRCQEIHIRRITKNGIEAFVDRKHILLVGTHTFMRRYGLHFPNDNKQLGRSTLCVSLDGKQSAKISVKYSQEPIFEMLVERLAEEKIHCVIETFDPLIHTEMIASTRTLGHTPVSVIHKNTDDMKYAKRASLRRNEPVDLVVVSSRLKLCEALIWCKRLIRIQRNANYLMGLLSFLGLSLAAVLLCVGGMSLVNQYWLLLWIGLTNLFLGIFVRKDLPKKHYFTVATLRRQLEQEERKKKANTSKKEMRKNQNS